MMFYGTESGLEKVPRSNQPGETPMFDGAVCARLGVILFFCFGADSPVMADKWPGDTPSPGGAISAKVVGQYCSGVLSPSEIAELDAYLAKAASELAQKEEAKEGSGFSSQSFEKFSKALAEDYGTKYRDPKACNAGASEDARDMLQRVRKAMAAGTPLFAGEDDPNRKPDSGQVILAKVTGEKCRGTLTALELAELELYLAKSWVQFAKSATDADTLATMEAYKSYGRDIENDFKVPQDCNAKSIGYSKYIAAQVHKSAE
jgi:hypothetical protein